MTQFPSFLEKKVINETDARATEMIKWINTLKELRTVPGVY